MRPRHKYARVEHERRFLLERLPGNLSAVRVRRITDRYIAGTTLRLRRQREDGGAATFKLTQKVQGLITTIYLAQDEYGVFSRLAAKTLRKTRYSVPPFGIDVFEGRLRGLVLAEAEFDSAAAMRALTVPSFVVREVSADSRFTGGSLVAASRREMAMLLSEHGIEPGR